MGSTRFSFAPFHIGVSTFMIRPRPNDAAARFPRLAGTALVSGLLCCLALQSQAQPGPGSDDTNVTDKPAPFSRTAAEVMASIDLGWNLGNALDAPGDETAWGNPPITPELFEAVAHAGFDLVRIPVTWSPHTGPGPAFEIDAGRMDRVEQVVDEALDAGLYAVINLHHDGADGFSEVEWLTLNDAQGRTTEANNAAVLTRFQAVWRQIAARFAEHGERLFFESMNEIHDGYGPPDPRHLAFVNRLNQAFVDLVRDSGGHNNRRYLVVPGYNTNIDHTLAAFELPDDPATPDTAGAAGSRLILSVHYYDPYRFALAAQTHTWGRASPGSEDWGQEPHVIAQFDKLKARFIDRGLPVLMGEYGATYQQGYEDYRRYYMEFVTKAAVDRDIVPVYWDNGGHHSGAENFALFNRSSAKPTHPDLIAAIVRAATAPYTLDDIAPPKAKP